MGIKLYVVGKNPAEKGKQLEQLTKIILEKQGYDNVCTNIIDVGGCEIDITATHKYKLMTASSGYHIIGECKAYARPIDTTDWLKFIGKLFIKRLKEKDSIGVMISLSGANGNVIGSYNDLKGQGFIHLITNDDLVSLLIDEYSLLKPKYIEIILKKHTDRTLAEIGLVYYCNNLYWIAGFTDGCYTLLTAKGELVNETELIILKEIITDFPFQKYVDILSEFDAKMRHSKYQKLILSILMEAKSALPLDKIISELEDIKRLPEPKINQEEIKAILNGNKFIHNQGDTYSIVSADSIDPVDFYHYILSDIVPERIICTDFYLSMINEQLLEHICAIQNGLKIPDNYRDDCIFLLKYSPTALNYALTKDHAITEYRTDKGNAIFENLEKAHVHWFMQKLIESFLCDYKNRDLHPLYLEKYKIPSITFDFKLTINNESKYVNVGINETLMQAKLGEVYALVSKIPE